MNIGIHFLFVDVAMSFAKAAYLTTSSPAKRKFSAQIAIQEALLNGNLNQYYGADIKRKTINKINGQVSS